MCPNSLSYASEASQMRRSIKDGESESSVQRLSSNASYPIGPGAIKKAQLEFFAAGKAGCTFAAIAAKRPERYGWRQVCLPVQIDLIQSATEQALSEANDSMISLIFPSVRDLSGLEHLIAALAHSEAFYLDETRVYEGYRCIGLRARVGELVSWVSGFGPFAFLPATRQAPFVEIAFRVKPRPAYKHFMKKSPSGIIHLADLDFRSDVSWAAFQKIWNTTLQKTSEILGHKPDLRSAAKTTFSLPQ